MTALRGIWSATITPVTPEFEPNAQRAIPYYRELLEHGCDGLNVLGTTGEAMSFSVDQRLRFMEAIATSGLPMARIMFGTGAASLADAARLMRGAFDLGVAAALVMPPFFYRDATDEGIMQFFDVLLARGYQSGNRVFLYNLPRMSGITFHADLVDRLTLAFPEAIAGMKDSSNTKELQSSVLARHPDFTVFPGSEEYVLEAKAYGAAGCISGTVCLWPKLAKSVFETGDESEAKRLAENRRAISVDSIIATVRDRVATAYDDNEWRRSMLPLASSMPSLRS